MDTVYLILASLIMLILSVVNPFIGLINYMVLLYLRPLQSHPYLAYYPIVKVFAAATILGFLLTSHREKKLFFNFKQDKILSLFLFVIVLSFTVGWIPRCLEFFEEMLKNVIVYGLIVGLITSEKRLKILIWALLLLSSILAFDAAQTFFDINPTSIDSGRLGGFSGAYFGNSGDFAVMMSAVIPFAFFLGVAARPFILQPAALFMMVLYIIAIVATRARGGLLSFGGAMLGTTYFGLRLPRIGQKFISVVLIVVAMVGIVAFAPSVFKERAATILDYKNQDTAWQRIEFWKLGIKMFLSSPIIGVGAGNYQLRYKDFGGWNNKWMVSHNMYIDTISELGSLGFGALFFLLYFTFKGNLATARLLRENKKAGSFLYITNRAAMLSLVAYCIGGMFLSILTYPILYIIVALNVATRNIALKSIERTA